MKFKILIFIIILIYGNNLNANVNRDLRIFKKELKQHHYEKAMDIYSKNINGLETKKFQNQIYKYIIKLIKINSVQAKKLINTYLNVEYNNPFGLYLLSKVHNIDKEYLSSIKILYELQTNYLDEQFKNNIENSLDKTVDNYLNYLKKENNLDKIYNFIDLASEYNDQYNITKVYAILLKIHQNELKNNNIISSLKILYKIKTYYIDNELLEKINRYLKSIIIKYTKQLLKNNDQTELDRLKNLITINADNTNIDTINNIIDKQNQHKYKIPLEKYGLHYLINITIEEQNFKFLLDTGATTSTINKSVINSINYKLIKDNIALNTANGITYSKLILINNIHVGNLSLNDFQLMVLQNDLSNFDGLLGMNFFKNYKFFIDQKTNTLFLD